MKITTIQISVETKEKLEKAKDPRETYEDVVKRLLNEKKTLLKEKYVCLRCGREGLKIGKCPYCRGIIVKKTVLKAQRFVKHGEG